MLACNRKSSPWFLQIHQDTRSCHGCEGANPAARLVAMISSMIQLHDSLSSHVRDTPTKRPMSGDILTPAQERYIFPQRMRKPRWTSVSCTIMNNRAFCLSLALPSMDIWEGIFSLFLILPYRQAHDTLFLHHPCADLNSQEECAFATHEADRGCFGGKIRLCRLHLAISPGASESSISFGKRQLLILTILLGCLSGLMPHRLLLLSAVQVIDLQSSRLSLVRLD